MRMNKINYWLKLCFEIICEFVSQDIQKDKINKRYQTTAEHILSITSFMQHCNECDNDEIKDDIAVIYYILGYVYSDVFFDYDKSLELYFNALNLYKNLPLTAPATVAAVYCNIAATYNDKGKYDESIEWNFKALKIREEVLGVYNEETAKSYHNIADMYLNMRDFDNALIWGNKALSVYEEILGENYETAIMLQLLGDIYNEIYETEKALSFYERGFDILTKQVELPNIYTNNNTDDLDIDFENNKPYEDALKASFNTLRITKKEIGDKNTVIAGVYNRIAFSYMERKEYEKALKYFFKALELHETILGYDHNFTADNYNNIRITYCMLNQNNKGLEYCLKALEIFEKIFGKKHSDTITLYVSIASIYSDMGNDEMAKIFIDKSKVTGE